jgi:hypothetical protein
MTTKTPTATGRTTADQPPPRLGHKALTSGFASFRGQRNRPGLWWFATTGEHVGHKSWLERDRLMALDATLRCAHHRTRRRWDG